MFPRAQGPDRRSRLVASARLRRALIYLLAAALVITAASVGVRLGLPPDPYAPVRVQRLPGALSQEGQTTTQVTYDAQTKRTAIEVRQPDGTVRRYHVIKSGSQWRIEGEAGASQ